MTGLFGAAGRKSTPALDEAYRACRRINARYGRTYFLATRFLPAASRPSVHALYGFARLADEIVDNAVAPGDPAQALTTLEKALAEAFAGAPPAHPVLLALTDTVRRHDIDEALFTEFLASMRMDLTITGYATFADLAEYTHGSAGVIGLQMLPVLGTEGPREEAAPYAAALGEAFQLTNFLRDVGEDLDRGRLYLPADELAAFGVDRAMLEHAHRTGRTERPIRRALAHLVSCTHAVYRRAEPGIALLAPRSRPCIAAATAMYRHILDEIADAGYDVLGRRVVVPTHRRLRIAVSAMARALPFRVAPRSR
ncbi:phytoene/squalene synthase family protein [Actinophytocola algeriensis]|uniref:Phytoene synthase n=1 Tax=Actinophytocola algeriensis TaxID=1768010 RepID=A0A7W7Q0X7_9PSEU|nr:phytoene/squalene synthase family protein [Actinophytocola algeriensis]MBB4904823.1 phytoene synthase [Actinophytocola algeriensis]MBE1476318.1 phytoene synthase [Actinophytocola algeriensis]